MAPSLRRATAGSLSPSLASALASGLCKRRALSPARFPHAAAHELWTAGFQAISLLFGSFAKKYPIPRREIGVADRLIHGEI